MMDYGDFRNQYEERHPASVPKMGTVIRDYPRFVIIAIWLAFLSISVSSGVHTVSTMRNAMEASTVLTNQVKDIVSLTSFFGFEVSLFISVFGWQRKGNRWIAYAATLVIFVVIVIANVRDVSISLESGNILDIATIILTGIGVPLVALSSGKTAVDYFRRDQINTLERDKKHATVQKRWDKEIDRAWSKHQAAEQKSLSVSVQLSDGHRTGGNYRTSDAQDTVKAYFKANPDAFQVSVRKIADELGVGKSTVADVRRMMQGENGNSTNGHGGPR